MYPFFNFTGNFTSFYFMYKMDIEQQKNYIKKCLDGKLTVKDYSHIYESDKDFLNNILITNEQ